MHHGQAEKKSRPDTLALATRSAAAGHAMIPFYESENPDIRNLPTLLKMLYRDYHVNYIRNLELASQHRPSEYMDRKGKEWMKFTKQLKQDTWKAKQLVKIAKTTADWQALSQRFAEIKQRLSDAKETMKVMLCLHKLMVADCLYHMALCLYNMDRIEHAEIIERYLFEAMQNNHPYALVNYVLLLETSSPEKRRTMQSYMGMLQPLAAIEVIENPLFCDLFEDSFQWSMSNIKIEMMCLISSMHLVVLGVLGFDERMFTHAYNTLERLIGYGHQESHIYMAALLWKFPLESRPFIGARNAEDVENKIVSLLQTALSLPDESSSIRYFIKNSFLDSHDKIIARANLILGQIMLRRDLVQGIKILEKAQSYKEAHIVLAEVYRSMLPGIIPGLNQAELNALQLNHLFEAKRLGSGQENFKYLRQHFMTPDVVSEEKNPAETMLLLLLQQKLAQCSLMQSILTFYSWNCVQRMQAGQLQVERDDAERKVNAAMSYSTIDVALGNKASFAGQYIDEIFWLTSAISYVNGYSDEVVKIYVKLASVYLEPEFSGYNATKAKSILIRIPMLQRSAITILLLEACEMLLDNSDVEKQIESLNGLENSFRTLCFMEEEYESQLLLSGHGKGTKVAVQEKLFRELLNRAKLASKELEMLPPKKIDRSASKHLVARINELFKGIPIASATPNLLAHLLYDFGVAFKALKPDKRNLVLHKYPEKLQEMLTLLPRYWSAFTVNELAMLIMGLTNLSISTQTNLAYDAVHAVYRAFISQMVVADRVELKQLTQAFYGLSNTDIEMPFLQLYLSPLMNVILQQQKRAHEQVTPKSCCLMLYTAMVLEKSVRKHTFYEDQFIPFVVKQINIIFNIFKRNMATFTISAIDLQQLQMINQYFQLHTQTKPSNIKLIDGMLKHLSAKFPTKIARLSDDTETEEVSSHEQTETVSDIATVNPFSLLAQMGIEEDLESEAEKKSIAEFPMISTLQREVTKFVESLGYRVLREENVNQCKVDLFIPELNTVIQVDGPTHFWNVLPVAMAASCPLRQTRKTELNSILVQGQNQAVNLIRVNFVEWYRAGFQQELQAELANIKQQKKKPVESDAHLLLRHLSAAAKPPQKHEAVPKAEPLKAVLAKSTR